MVRTHDGGSHETGAKQAFTKVFNEYARKNGFLKEKDKGFDGSDVREGLTLIINLTIPEDYLQFEGQTKENWEHLKPVRLRIRLSVKIYGISRRE